MHPEYVAPRPPTVAPTEDFTVWYEELSDGRYVAWATFARAFGSQEQGENLISPTDDCRSTAAVFAAAADLLVDAGYDTVKIVLRRRPA